MPQIWLTYDELADYSGLAIDEARAQVLAEGWARRRSRDGLVRIKLMPAAGVEYMRSVARAFETSAETTTNQQVAMLRSMLALADGSPRREDVIRAA